MLINTQGMKLINRQSSKKKLRPVPRKQQRAAALQYQDRTRHTSTAETSTPPLHTSINYPVNPFSASLFSTHLNTLLRRLLWFPLSLCQTILSTFCMPKHHYHLHTIARKTFTTHDMVFTRNRMFFSTKHISIFIFWRYIWTLAALTHPPSPLGRLPERSGLEQSQDLSNNPWGGGTDEEEVKRKVEIQETKNPDHGQSWLVLVSFSQSWSGQIIIKGFF